MTCDAAALPLSKPALLGFRSSALSLVLVALALLYASIGPSCVLDVSAYLSYLYLTHSC